MDSEIDAVFVSLFALIIGLGLFAGLGCITGTLAARKGYDYWRWFFAAGIPGLLCLCFLPFANDPNMPYSEQCNLVEKGNNLARIFVGVNFVLFLLRMLTAM